MCAIKEIQTVSGQRMTGDHKYKSRLHGAEHVAEKIEAGEKYTELLPLTAFLETLKPVKSADIAIVLSFRANSFVPWRQERAFRFIIATGKNGDRYWLPQPIDR